MGARYGTRTIVLAALLCTAAGAPVAHAEEGATIASLRIAVQREENARWHYVAYEMAARREGQPRAANLFRAAAAAEAVHAAGHRAELERLGGAELTMIESVVVGRTAENLAAAIAGERRERDEIYRTFADFARRECLYDALATFNYARGAEATHLALFEKELARLQAAAPAKQLLADAVFDPQVMLGTEAPECVTYVCGGCGCLYEVKPAKSCPSCGSGPDRIVAVH